MCQNDSWPPVGVRQISLCGRGSHLWHKPAVPPESCMHIEYGLDGVLCQSRGGTWAHGDETDNIWSYVVGGMTLKDNSARSAEGRRHPMSMSRRHRCEEGVCIMPYCLRPARSSFSSKGYEPTRCRQSCVGHDAALLSLSAVRYSVRAAGSRTLIKLLTSAETTLPRNPVT